jgi:hypothetical protein
LAASVLSGCASQPKPDAQLVRASTLIGQAEKDQAQRYAAADLQRARDELSSARSAEADGKYDSARNFADRASVDADLASARASSSRPRSQPCRCITASTRSGNSCSRARRLPGTRAPARAVPVRSCPRVNLRRRP